MTKTRRRRFRPLRALGLLVAVLLLWPVAAGFGLMLVLYVAAYASIVLPLAFLALATYTVFHVVRAARTIDTLRNLPR